MSPKSQAAVHPCADRMPRTAAVVLLVVATLTSACSAPVPVASFGEPTPATAQEPYTADQALHRAIASVDLETRPCRQWDDIEPGHLCFTMRVLQSPSTIGTSTLVALDGHAIGPGLTESSPISAVSPSTILLSDLASTPRDLADLHLDAETQLVELSPRGGLATSPSLRCSEEPDPLNDGVQQRCRSRLEDAAVDLAAYQAVDVARDVAALRRALDVDTWHVIVDSTSVFDARELIAAFAHADATGTESLTLRNIGIPNGAAKQIPATVASLRSLGELCAANDTCARDFPTFQPGLEQLLEGGISELVVSHDITQRTWLDEPRPPVNTDEIMIAVGRSLSGDIRLASELEAVVPLAVTDLAAGRPQLFQRMLDRGRFFQPWRLDELEQACSIDPSALLGTELCERGWPKSVPSPLADIAPSFPVLVFAGAWDPTIDWVATSALAETHAVVTYQSPATHWPYNDCAIENERAHRVSVEPQCELQPTAFASPVPADIVLDPISVPFEYLDLEITAKIPRSWGEGSEGPWFYRSAHVLDAAGLWFDIFTDTDAATAIEWTLWDYGTFAPTDTDDNAESALFTEVIDRRDRAWTVASVSDFVSAEVAALEFNETTVLVVLEADEPEIAALREQFLVDILSSVILD